jgi:hypothetical protein
VPELVRREAVDGGAAQADAARCRPFQAEEDLQECALAGPVGTDDGDDLTVVDPERDAVDGRQAAEALGDGLNLE